MKETELKPCHKCNCLCRVEVVKTMANKYRIGCTIHSVWQEDGFDSVNEAVEDWNRRADNEQRAD